MKRMAIRILAAVFAWAVLVGALMGVPKAHGMSVKIYYIRSLEEYERELAKYAIPGDYVTYDMVRMVGEFDYLLLGTRNNFSNQNIRLGLRDQAGYEVKLSISYGDGPQTIRRGDSVSDLWDLRRSESDYKGAWRYIHGDITYRYYEEDLKEVWWTHNKRQYCLSYVGEGNGFRDYPREAKTFVSRLLNADTAQTALDELMASVDAGQVVLKRQAFWQKLSEYAAIFGGGALIIGGWIAIWKWRERKRLLLEIEEEEFMAAHREA